MIQDLEYQKLLRSFEIMKDRTDEWLRDYLAAEQEREQAEKRAQAKQPNTSRPTQNPPRPFRGTSTRDLFSRKRNRS